MDSKNIIAALVGLQVLGCASVTDQTTRESTVSMRQPLAAAQPCNAYQAQQFGDASFGIQAEAGDFSEGSPTIVQYGRAFGGKTVRFSEGDLVKIPVTFREQGTYDLYLRGRASGSASSNEVYASYGYTGDNGIHVSFDPNALMEWQRVTSIDVGGLMVHRSNHVYIRGLEDGFELDAVAFVRTDPVPAGGIPDPDEPFVHIQKSGADILAFPAEAVDEIEDNDGDGKVFERLDGGFTQNWEMLKAPEVDPGVSDQESYAVYRVKFDEPGDYQLCVRARGFNTGTDSIYVPLSLTFPPTEKLAVSNDGAFAWTCADAPVTVPYTDARRFRLAAREKYTEVDSVAFVKAGIEASPERLNAAMGYFEAEDAVLSGVSVGQDAAASGGQRVSSFRSVGDSMRLGVVPEGRLYIRYALGYNWPKQASVYVDGVDVGTAQFMSTGGWANYDTTFVYVPAGEVMLRIDPDDEVANDHKASAYIDRVSLGEDGNECIVSTKDELNSALASAQPGDTILLPASSSWIGKLFSRDLEIALQRSGAPDRPITLRAERAGDVQLTGDSGITLAGDYSIVDGLGFFGKHTGQRDVIVVEPGTKHDRVTNTTIIGYNPEQFVVAGKAVKRKWLYAKGRYHRFDHNHFANKRYRGAVVFLTHEQGRYDYMLFDHNYLESHPNGGGACSAHKDEFPSADDAGWDGCTSGWSNLALGNGSFQLAQAKAGTTIQYNLLYRSDGYEGEAISCKSTESRFFYNTLRQNAGPLTLRQGHNHWIEGNVFIEQEKGIRVYGSDHTIVNNYFQDVSRGLEITPGVANNDVIKDDPNSNDPDDVLSCYAVPESITIGHNSFVFSGTDSWSSHAALRYSAPKACVNQLGRQMLLPNHLVIANNRVSVPSTLEEAVKAVRVDSKDGQAFGPENVKNFTNITATSSVPLGWDFMAADLAQDPLGIWRDIGELPSGYTVSTINSELSSGSGYPEFPNLTADVDGQPVGGTRRVGADELSADAVHVNVPLGPGDVGPSWGARFNLVFDNAVFKDDRYDSFDPGECHDICLASTSTSGVATDDCCHCDGQYGHLVQLGSFFLTCELTE